MRDDRLRHEAGLEGECEALAEAMSAYLDGALDAIERERVEAHLRRCVSCVRALEALRRADAGLRELVAVAPDVRVWEELSALVATGEGGRGDGLSSRSWTLEGGVHANAVVLGAGLVLVLVSWLSGGWTGAASAVAALPVAWIASRRLEGRFGARGLLVVIALGAGPALAVGPARAFAPAGVVATLAVAQCLVAPRLVLRVAGRRVRAPLAAGLAIAISAALARPDLIGVYALVPVAGGAAVGAASTLATRTRRAA